MKNARIEKEAKPKFSLTAVHANIGAEESANMR